MDFQSFGDAQGYLGAGALCAESIRSEDFDLRACYSSIRPVGILLYYALPYLLTTDPTTAIYLTLLLNIVCFVVLWKAAEFLLEQQQGFRTCSAGSRTVIKGVLMVGVLCLSIPFIPVRLADHQSLAFFVLGLAIFSNSDLRPPPRLCVAAGFFAGCAVLLKQNYVVAGSALIVLMVLLRDRGCHFRTSIWPVLSFMAGFAVISLQLLVTFVNSGVLWFYEPGALDAFAASNRQPVVELTAYLDPKPSAYLSSLDREVSAIEYFATKFYHGVSKFYWSVYLGKPPLETTPELLKYTTAELNSFIAVFVGTVVVACSVFLLRNRAMTVLVMSALVFTCVSVYLGHTEFRYFLFFRLAALMLGLELVCRALSFRAAKRRLWIPPT